MEIFNIKKLISIFGMTGGVPLFSLLESSSKNCKNVV